MSTSKYGKEHEIFFKERDYDIIRNQYKRQTDRQWTQEELLIIAKSFFIISSYQDCLDIIQNINPAHSSKVLYERQCLKFKAYYLLKRTEIPRDHDFQNLKLILDEADKLKGRVPGPPFTEYHNQVLKNYRFFISFLMKHINSTINFSEPIYQEQLQLNKRTHKKTGFPCYFISSQWQRDFRRATRNTGYMNPPNNFQIVNDIFELFPFQSQLDNHKNIVIFPGHNSYEVISKRLWLYFCTMFSGGNEFNPVKRLFSQRQQYYDREETIQLVPAAVKCGEDSFVIQLTANSTSSAELLRIVEQRYGKGQLSNPYNEEASFDIFYTEDKEQKSMAEFNKFLVYQLIQVPPRLVRYNFFKHIDYRPLKASQLKKSVGGLKGLENCGNSCYMSACLQCIRFTRELSEHLSTKDLTRQILKNLAEDKQNSREGIITFALSDLFKKLWRDRDEKFISPFKFKKYFSDTHDMFRGKTQEDAHEFLLCLLNSVHEDLQQSNKPRVQRINTKLQNTTDIQRVNQYFQKHQIQENKSIIMDNFRGILHTTIKCHQCKVASHSFDWFLALSLPIPFVSYPTFSFYFVQHESRATKKYEICLKNIDNFNDLFKKFNDEVLIHRKELPKNKYYQQSALREEKPKTKKYLLIQFQKGEEPKQIWNAGFSNILTQVKISIEQLKKNKNSLIIYEVEAESDDQLSLVEYKYNPTFGREKTLGMPKFLLLKQREIKQKEDKQFIKLAVLNDYENSMYESDIKEMKRFIYDNANPSFKYCLTLYFKREERLFLESAYADKELNLAADKYHLRDCFDYMGKAQMLDPGWKCGNCGSKQGAEKRQYLSDTNQILIISLKRFQMTGNKIKNLIEYPITDLNINEWIEKDPSNLGNRFYDLYAVCLHQGTMEYGHYRAYCKHFVSGQWYEFDDERVKKVDEEDIVSPNAYMLFYKLRDI